MAAIDETELRFVLEGLNKDQLTSILENNGYSYKGKDDFLIRQIMTKISYSVIIEELINHSIFNHHNYFLDFSF